MVIYCRARWCWYSPGGPICQRTTKGRRRVPKGLGPTYRVAYCSASETFQTPRPSQNKPNKLLLHIPYKHHQPDGRTNTKFQDRYNVSTDVSSHAREPFKTSPIDCFENYHLSRLLFDYFQNYYVDVRVLRLQKLYEKSKK